MSNINNRLHPRATTCVNMATIQKGTGSVGENCIAAKDGTEM